MAEFASRNSLRLWYNPDRESVVIKSENMRLKASVFWLNMGLNLRTLRVPHISFGQLNIDKAHRFEILLLLKNVVDPSSLDQEVAASAAIQRVHITKVLIRFVENGLAFHPLVRVLGIQQIQDARTSVRGDLLVQELVRTEKNAAV